MPSLKVESLKVESKYKMHLLFNFGLFNFGLGLTHCVMPGVLLACLIHAASVHPELGSNSFKRE